MGSGTPSVSATNLKLAWRNLGRNPRRTLLAWAGIAVAQITLVWLSSFMNGYESLIFEKLTGPMLGHVQVHAPRYRDDSAIERTIPGATEVIHKIEQQPHVANVSPRVYGPVLATAQELGHVAMVTGLNLPGETGASGLIEGMPRDQLPGPQECLIGKSLAAEMMVHPGDTLALMGQAVDGSVASGLYKVKGIVESDVEQINRAGILLNMAAAQELLAMNDQVHELAIHVDRPENIPGVLAALRKSPDLSRFEILDWKELVPQLSAFLQISGVTNLIILVLIFLTTISGIANTMLMATFERSHEFGMLMALGCRPARLIRILLLESVALGLSGVLIGSVIGAWIVMGEMRHGISVSGANGVSISLEGLSLGFKLFPVLKVSDIGRGVVAVVLTSALATIWPARRISRLEPIEAMRS